MSRLNRSSSSSYMASPVRVGEVGVGHLHATAGREPFGAHPRRRRGFARLLSCRSLLRIHLAHLDRGVGELRRQVVESQIPGAVSILEGDTDLGPPGLLVVSGGALHGADELHNFR